MNNLNLKKTNFTFFADKNDILLKNIFGNLEDIKLFDGDIQLNLENAIKISSNFNSKINLDEKLLKKYFNKNNDTFYTLKILKADLNNNLLIVLDSTYKVQDYNYSISGKIDSANFEILRPINNNFLTKEIKKIYFQIFK